MKDHIYWDTVTAELLEKVMKEMHYTINNLIPIQKIQQVVITFLVLYLKIL